MLTLTEERTYHLFQIKALTTSERRAVCTAVRRIENDLLPKMGFVNSFCVRYLQDTDTLGVYVPDTHQSPTICLDPMCIKNNLKYRDDVQLFYLECLMTLAHEVAHAYQDRLGILDETEAAELNAELFAYNWVTYGEVDLNLLRPN